MSLIQLIKMYVVLKKYFTFLSFWRRCVATFEQKLWEDIGLMSYNVSEKNREMDFIIHDSSKQMKFLLTWAHILLKVAK